VVDHDLQELMPLEIAWETPARLSQISKDGSAEELPGNGALADEALFASPWTATQMSKTNRPLSRRRDLLAAEPSSNPSADNQLGERLTR